MLGALYFGRRSMWWHEVPWRDALPHLLGTGNLAALLSPTIRLSLWKADRASPPRLEARTLAPLHSYPVKKLGPGLFLVRVLYLLLGWGEERLHITCGEAAEAVWLKLWIWDFPYILVTLLKDESP